MSATIEVQGEIEIVCHGLNDLGPNKLCKLVFRSFEDAAPPFQIRVRSPTGGLILERVVRELPTGEPQSPPPIQFLVQEGDYDIHIAQIRGGVEGRATLSVRR